MFRIVATLVSVKNVSSLVGVHLYTSLVFAVFSSNLAWLWIAIAFQTGSEGKRGSDPDSYSPAD